LFHILGSRFWTWVCFLIPIVWDHCSHTHTCYFARIHPHHEHQSNFKNILHNFIVNLRLFIIELEFHFSVIWKEIESIVWKKVDKALQVAGVIPACA
jgi:hypothetical protein